MNRRSHLLTILSLLIGSALFVFVIRQAGTEQLLARLRAIGPGFVWILLVSGLRPAMRALAWLRCLRQTERQQLSVFTVWRARLVGDAIGNLTMTGPITAEPTRLLFIAGRIPFAHAAYALSLEYLLYLVSCCVVLLAGLLALLVGFALDDSLRTISLLLLAALLVGLLVAGVGFRQRWSIAGLLQRLVQRLAGTQRAGQWLLNKLRHLRKLEKLSFDFYRQHPRDFLLLCFCEAIFHALGVLEIQLTLRLIGEQPGFIVSFVFEAVNRFINMAFAFVPVKVGVDEAGTALLAATLGFAALTGVTLAVYRKLRVLFWTLVGLLFLALPNRQRESDIRISPTKSHEEDTK